MVVQRITRLRRPHSRLSGPRFEPNGDIVPEELYNTLRQIQREVPWLPERVVPTGP